MSILFECISSYISNVHVFKVGTRESSNDITFIDRCISICSILKVIKVFLDTNDIFDIWLISR